jgi:hypothetical protein
LEKEIFHFPISPDWLWNPPSFLFSEYRVSFPGIKQPEREVKNEVTSLLPLHALKAWTGTILPFYTKIFCPPVKGDGTFSVNAL